MNEEINVDEAQIGRVLHFVIDKSGRPQCRPALVVEDWPSQGKPGYVNLVVFPDGSNDGKWGIDNHAHQLGKTEEGASVVTLGTNVPLLTRWETSVLPNHAVRAVRSWHWPRECIRLEQPMEPYKPEHENPIPHNHAVSVVDTHNCYACSRQTQDLAKTV